MPKLFIDRPVLAWVVAILISLGGIISLMKLGVESYPAIAPPQVTITATYPGANAQTIEQSITQVIEQQLTGVDHLVYFDASSSSSGQAILTLTFEPGTDPDIAQVQVQNKVSMVTPRLPSEVVQQGIVVAKANPSFLMVIGLRSSRPTMTQIDLNDIVGSQVLDQVARIPGVGNVRQFGGEYAINIWLNPKKLHGYGLSPSQVFAAVKNQNMQFASGAVGSDPAPLEQHFTATLAAEGRFQSPEQFANIVLRSQSDGAVVRLRDVARIQIAGATSGIDSRFNGQPAGAFAVQLLPGANALTVAAAVRAKMTDLQSSFPSDVSWFVPFDSTSFVTVSIHEVIETLLEAIVLVFFVMLIFLQNLRTTIIPTLVIPIALLGTMIGLNLIGYTINQLTLFVLVLAIGIIVDDAIVVIENVERIMRQEQQSARQATELAMQQITGAIIAITLVLAAVFLPSGFQPSASGAIYKQFAVTIAIAMAFSAFLALSFTPALCALILKPTHSHERGFFHLFNIYYERLATRYEALVHRVLGHWRRWLVFFVLIVGLCGLLYGRLPTSFVPEEDQGAFFLLAQLPPGATKTRTDEVFGQVRQILRRHKEVDGLFEVSGFSFVGVSENAGMGFVQLKPWDERKVTSTALIQQLNAEFSTIKSAQIFAVNMPTIQGLGQFGGFDLWLQDRSNAGQAALLKARNQILGEAAQHPETVVAVRPNGLEASPQLQLQVDRLKAAAMGISVNDVYSAIQLMLAPNYVNDFVYHGRMKRVNLRADMDYRSDPAALEQIFIPSTAKTGDSNQTSMLPISTVLQTHWQLQSPSQTRFNGYSAVNIVGNIPPGGSSGQAMSFMENIVNHELPKGFAIQWSGMSYQEILAGNTTGLLLLLSIGIVFLCLAGLYESWSIPVAVILVVPIGILGVVVFTLLRGLPNDLYFKIGMITVIGLSAKNAILIVEFAVEQCQAGKGLIEAATNAARLRFRPILMTSFAFILGVLPLAISTGAGANSRHSLGTGVIGGMLFATIFGLIFIPLFFFVINRLIGGVKTKQPTTT